MPARPGAKPRRGTGRNASSKMRAMFIDAYFASGQNQSRAAIAIGFPAERADSVAKNFMAHPKVTEEIDRRLAELAAPHALTAAEVIASMARALRFDPAKLYYQDGPNKGQLKHVFDMDEDTRLELAGIEVEEMKIGDKATSRTAKVKHPNKQGARDQGMRLFGLNKKDNEQKISDPDEIAARVRAKLASIDGSTSGGKK